MHIEYIYVGVHSNSINLLYMLTKCKYTSLYVYSISHVENTYNVNIGFCFIVQDHRFCVPMYVCTYITTHTTPTCTLC